MKQPQKSLCRQRLRIAVAILASVVGSGSVTGAEFIELTDDPRVTKSIVSADGSTVAGVRSGGPFIWNAVDGVVGIDFLQGDTENRVYCISDDGSIVGGELASGRGFRWSRPDGALDTFGPRVKAMSGDGQILVLQSRNPRQLFYSGPEGESFVGNDLSANDISADGTVVVGKDRREFRELNLGGEAMVWTPGNGVQGLGMNIPDDKNFNDQIYAPSSNATAISSDGETVVGYNQWGYKVNPDQVRLRSRAFRWTETAGMIDLASLVGNEAGEQVNDVSADGRVIVGWAGDGYCAACTAPEFAVLWTETNEIIDLKTMLVEEFGLTEKLEGWQLTSAESVSADGSVIAGRGVDPNGITKSWLVDLAAIAGDLDRDRVLDASDIDFLSTRLRQGNDDPRLDLDGSGSNSLDDHAFWVKQLANTWIGDANLDGEFNTTDLVDIFRAGEYEDDIDGNSGWGEGDWNADGDFTTSDLTVAFQDGGYEQGPRAVVASVPEPSSLVLLLFSVAIYTRRRRE